MKKRIFFFLFLFTICPLFYLSQGTMHFVGASNVQNTPTTYPSIYGNYFRGAKHQIIIRANELTAAGMSAGNITSLGFDVVTPSGSTIENLEIEMKHTTSNSITNGWDNNSLTTVFGPINYSDQTGWNQHQFHTPFSWDGISNILIQTCFYNNGWSDNAVMNMSNYSYNTLIYRRRDNTTPCTSNWINGYETERPNIRFQWQNPQSPPAADFSVNTTSTCGGSVTFTDQTSNNPTSWLWDFGDGSTSTQQNPVHTYTSSGNYSVQLTASNPYGNNSMLKSNYIAVNLAGINPIPNSCTPATLNGNLGFGITEVHFGNLSNTSLSAVEGYADFTCDSTLVHLGSFYDFLAVHSSPTFHNCSAWIDFNNDGIFDPTGELIASSTSSDSTFAQVQIPNSAVQNTPLRMRVVADYDLIGAVDPCSDPQYGQAEDYTIFVAQNTSPPIADFEADVTYSCDGTVNFSDLSSNAPFAWYWNFGDGSNSVAQNPTHTYSVDGIYDVMLISSNQFGTDTAMITQYIEVNTAINPVAPTCQPTTLSYCCDYGISRVIFNDIDNPSYDGSEGYKDFSCTDQTDVNMGNTYSIKIFTGISNPQDTKVWIDFNNDGAFDDLTELVLSKFNDYDPVANVYIPTNAVTATPLRMRIASDEVGNNFNSCDDMNRGQIEDYAIFINDTSCYNPSDLAVNNIGPNYIGLEWVAGGNENNWDIAYGSSGFSFNIQSAYTTISNVSTNQWVVTGLSNSQYYDFYVRANCNFSSSSWIGPIDAFTNINNLTNNSPKLYPNPNNGLFNIESSSPIKTIKIYDLLGKEVFNKDFNYIHDNFYQISLMSEQKGVYIVKMEDFTNNFNTQRVILK